MQRLEVSGAVQPLYGSLGVKGLSTIPCCDWEKLDILNYNTR